MFQTMATVAIAMAGRSPWHRKRRPSRRAAVVTRPILTPRPFRRHTGACPQVPERNGGAVDEDPVIEDEQKTRRISAKDSLKRIRRDLAATEGTGFISP